MIFPPNFPLYKAAMDVYNDKTKPVTNFDFSNDAGFKKAISEAFEKAMDDKRFRAATNNELPYLNWYIQADFFYSEDCIF